MNKFLFYALLAFGSFVAPAHAQQAASAFIVASCGTLPTGVVYAAGQYGIQTMDTTGKSCSGATFSGSVSATTAATSASTLPTLSSSASSPIYESLGAGLYVQPVFGSASGGGTQVDATHGLPVNVIAGGAGGGGAVFGPTAAGSAAANPPVLAGGTIDGTATGNVSVFKIVSGVGSLNTAQVNGVTTLAGAGAVGTGSQRIAVGQDTTTIAGSAPGTAGTASTNVLTAQGIASMTPFLVNPGTITNWGLVVSTQNSATPTNGGLVEGQFNTTPTTITSGNVSPLQMDASGNLLVNIKAGAGSGGTAIADNTAFTLGTTSETPIGCYNGTATTTAAHVGIVGCTAAGSLHTTVDNTNANGQAAIASSSPVAVARNSGTGSTIAGSVPGTAGTASADVITVQGAALMTPVAISAPLNTTPTDCSGTITTGGTAQNAFSAQAALHGFTVMNLSTDPMWISFTTTAAIGATQSYLLAAGSSTVQGGSYSTPFGFGMNTALSLIAATTSDKFSCTRW